MKISTGFFCCFSKYVKWIIIFNFLILSVLFLLMLRTKMSFQALLEDVKCNIKLSKNNRKTP